MAEDVRYRWDAQGRLVERVVERVVERHGWPRPITVCFVYRYAR